jgi:glucokinase
VIDQRCVACLDVGGTSVKSAVVLRQGVLPAESYHHDPVDSAGTADRILESFSAALERAMTYARRSGMTLEGIGIAICGPFDYENGISKIKDLDKYDSLYDVNVKAGLQKRLALPGSLPILFDVDAWSFARGEVWVGAGRPYRRVIAFTMGTGVGSAFSVDQKIVGEGPGVPWLGWISGQKYRDGILNDYISRTFMIHRYRDLTGDKIDIREMAERARQGDQDAAQVFHEMAAELGKFLSQHHVQAFGAECLVFGGQISKSYDLFVEPIWQALADIRCLQAIVPAADIEHSALLGAAKYVFDQVSSSGQARRTA